MRTTLTILLLLSTPAIAQNSLSDDKNASVGVPAEPIAPADIQTVNEPTASATAVYLADAAAKERGDRSQIMVLGTEHLRILPADFDVTRFDPLLDRLEVWAPDRIAIETLSGPQCDYLRAYEFRYGDTAETYCFDPQLARSTLGITGPEAVAAIEAKLSGAGDQWSAAERRAMTALFMAAGDPVSAMVHWLQLRPAERMADDGLTADLIEQLQARLNRKSEDVIIAAALAARLGHNRVFLVDDHTYYSQAPADQDVYNKEMREIWDNEWGEQRLAYLIGWSDHFIADQSASVLDWYYVVNRPKMARLAVGHDFGAAAGAITTENSGRRYLAYWETRNLRMAANIREAASDGARMLAIVGAAHKPYYERYLGVTSDLEITDVLSLLEP